VVVHSSFVPLSKITWRESRSPIRWTSASGTCRSESANRAQAPRSSSSHPGLTRKNAASSDTTPSRIPLPDFTLNSVM
jgi:hypothetical protein